MNKALDIVAKILSVVFYPLFAPTYGIVLYCGASYATDEPLPLVYSVAAVMLTVFTTVFIPITSILIRMYRGSIKDIQIENAEERTVPYLYTIFCFGVWSFILIHSLQAPFYLFLIAVGATLAILLVTVINLFWKISAHMTGLGGLFGGFITYCMGTGTIPSVWSMCLWISVILLVMYARLRLNAHTPGQVIAGWLLGIVCTTIPYCIIWYAA